MSGTASGNFSAGNRGITEGEGSFEQFSVALVQNTMDALVSSAISQMKAYADLVATLERGLTTFRSEANPTDGSAIIAWLTSNLTQVTFKATNPDEVDLTATPKWNNDSVDVIEALFAKANQIATTTFLLADASPGNSIAPGSGLLNHPIAAEQFAKSGVNVATTPHQLVPSNAQDLASLVAGAPVGSAPIATILDAINAVLNNEAEQSFNQLLALVKAGLYRIVVTDGYITTKAMFSLQATDQAQQSAANVSVSNLQIAASARYGGRRLSASAAASYSKLNISVAQSSSSASTNITENIMGEVRVNFRGDYFPAAAIQTQP